MKTARELPVVTHLTQVKFEMSLTREELEEATEYQTAAGPDNAGRIGKLMTRRAERITAMMKLLSSCGFCFEIKKSVIYAYSNEVEAFEAKQKLLNAGFKDYEFQIVLEYTRGWGML